MDECVTPIKEPDLTAPGGDVDDLIFCGNSDWFVSER